MGNKKFITITTGGVQSEPQYGIFPILKQLEDDTYKLIGTAFFITDSGIFLTAKHVLMDVLDNECRQTHPIAAFTFLPNGIMPIRRVLKAFLNASGDVAAGILENRKNDEEPLLNPYSGLSRITMNPDDKIFTYAYPEMTCVGNEINIKPDFYEGQIQLHYPQGRDRVFLPNPCYQTSLSILGGASGGPVFNAKGHIMGINSTGYTLPEDDLSLSYISDINGVFDIVLEDIYLPHIGYIKVCTIEELCQSGIVKTDITSK
jgi:hypothetical protein